MLWKLKKLNRHLKSTSFLESYRKPKTPKILPVLLLIIVLKKKPNLTYLT